MNGRRTIPRGFTLIETIATIAILSVIGSVASYILFSAVDSFADASTASQLQSEASITLDRVIRTLRNIERDDGAAGIAPHIQSVPDADEIHWLDAESDAWSFHLTGGNLMFEENGAAAELLQGDVTGLTLRLYDESDAQIAVPLPANDPDIDDIRRIEVELTLAREGVSVTLRSRVFIRATMLDTGA
jgi:prepilin-type N-terminal cleavage/methylation domain-containing protein